MAADPPPPDRPREGSSTFADLSQMAQVLGQFVAPATLLAGLLFYWGFFHARGFCGYFGIDSQVLGFSTTDYVMRSADGLFIPLAVCAVVTLAFTWGRVAIPPVVLHGALPKWVLIAGVIAGALLLLNGLSQLWFDNPLNWTIGVAPSCSIIGLLLLWGVVRTRRRQLAAGSMTAPSTTTPLEWGLVFLLVAGSFFWGATDYSLAVGIGRAQRFETETLRTAPGLTIYAEKALDLRAPGVTATACTTPDSVYRYRYDGLVLVMMAGDNLVTVPRTWSRAQGSAMVLSRSASGAMRLEFTRPATAKPPAMC
ncbi:hypothetical protein IFM12275_68280 [Nocardia sputorum]|uniref:Uncharacterized protein n=2 Tax=Nocardia sputorum TaxID=2984338 RepID=A0ABM8CUG6_9NOCA|nr:hypothetical protein [Nocardia sputorum]BDT96852.1 hypothetical protein IFM12275_68280 [Nocardia sputorum]BDT98602.1 hypothetical protein IFM12276_16310 [Nocardia sputorum]